MGEKSASVSYGTAAFLLWLGQLDWSTISMVLGCILGIATFFVNLYYKRKNSKIYETAVKRGYLDEPQDEPDGSKK